MPLYEFTCDKGHRFEVLCSVYGQIRPSDICPVCKSPHIKKVPSVPSDPRGGDTKKFYVKDT